jgi:hypothetical protein
MGSTRRLLVAVVSVLLGALAVAAAPVPAWASAADAVTIRGDDLPDAIVVRASNSPQLTAALFAEVSWLVGRSATADEPEPDAVGPRYVLEVHIDGEVRHRYELYPLADGGPRVFRPQEQPGGRTADPAWYFGRLSMPDTLYAAGIEVPGAQPRVPGGGGGGEPLPQATAPPAGADGMMAAWREGVLLTALVALAIVIGLALVALLIRSKV